MRNVCSQCCHSNYDVNSGPFDFKMSGTSWSSLAKYYKQLLIGMCHGHGYNAGLFQINLANSIRGSLLITTLEQ